MELIMKYKLNKSYTTPISNPPVSINADSKMEKFKKVAKELEDNLNHAFRYGSSAFRLGLIPKGVSDHLPIVMKINLGQENLQMMSWNLLADEHLFNNFMNITGSSLLETALDNQLGDAKNIYNGAMYHLFAELAQYLYPIISDENHGITIDENLLRGFVPNSAQPSRRARSRTPEVAQEKEALVELARNAVVDILLNASDPNHHEYCLAIEQSLELIYHIKDPNGALRWENRFERLKGNKKAVAEFLSQDIIALQECTNPNDIEILFQSAEKSMTMISHNASNSDTSTDNVVLAFDSEKYSIVEAVSPGNPILTNFEGKKPAIYCKLLNHETGQEFIVASIHHPGGGHDLRTEIIENIKLLQAGNSAMPFFIAGDYNHTNEQFVELTPEGKDALPNLYYPSTHGTMSGSDYGNTNQCIDAIMSNTDLTGMVEISSAIQASQPAETPIKINFELSRVEEDHDSRMTPIADNATLNPDEESNQLYSLRKGILMAIIMAKDNYLAKKIRPGYPQTIQDLNLNLPFSSIEQLYTRIEQNNNPLIAFNLLTDHLTDENASWDPYDFNNYLIDALKFISRDTKQEISNIDWNCFTPCAVKRFEGVVYRGTSSTPEKVFNKGFTDYEPSNDIKDYTEFRNLSTGVSTSRSYDLAESYTKVASRQGKSRFVYTILFRGVGAVDIVETAKAQGIDLNEITNPQAMKALAKDEINIIDNIPPQQILYATEFLDDGSQVIHKNPNYDPSYIVTNINYGVQRPNREQSFFNRIYNFFADAISYFKSLFWALNTDNQGADYGIERRSREIESNPIMQEAEAIFDHITNTNSFDLISAHLAVNTTVPNSIPPQPEDSEKIKLDGNKPKSAALEIIDEPLSTENLVSLQM